LGTYPIPRRPALRASCVRNQPSGACRGRCCWPRTARPCIALICPSGAGVSGRGATAGGLWSCISSPGTRACACPAGLTRRRRVRRPRGPVRGRKPHRGGSACRPARRWTAEAGTCRTGDGARSRAPLAAGWSSRAEAEAAGCWWGSVDRLWAADSAGLAATATAGRAWRRSRPLRRSGRGAVRCPWQDGAWGRLGLRKAARLARAGA